MNTYTSCMDNMFHHYTAPRVHRLEDLSELEQRLFYTRILCTHFSFLYQHLNTPAILETLRERELIVPDEIEVIKKYSNRLAQNTLAIHRMQSITAPPNCMEKLCEIFLSQGHIAQKLHSSKIFINISVHDYIVFLYRIPSTGQIWISPTLSIFTCSTDGTFSICQSLKCISEDVE